MLEWFKNLPTFVKGVASVVTMITVVGGAAIGMDKTYVDEQEAAQTLEQFKRNLDAENAQRDQAQKMLQYNFYTEQYYNKRREAQANPDNQIIQEEFQHYKERKETLGKELGL